MQSLSESESLKGTTKLTKPLLLSEMKHPRIMYGREEYEQHKESLKNE